VSICRALIHDPEILLMDEPFSALDALTRDEMGVELLRIWQANRKTVIFVTHSIREAAFLSDRVLVMARRPATIIDEVAIDLPRPRSIAMMEEEGFNRYVRRLRKAIRRAMPAKLRRQITDLAWPIAISLGLRVLWEVAVRELGIRSIILPPPSEIFQAIIARRDLLLAHLWPSLYLTVLGFALSVVGGILVAILVTYSSAMRKGFYPVIVVSQVVPKISIAPLFVVWFGTGKMSSLLLAFLVAFFPMTINAAMGFQAVDEDIHRMARTFMGSRWQIFWKIRMPNALPYIFGGMKISITLAIIGVRIR